MFFMVRYSRTKKRLCTEISIFVIVYIYGTGIEKNYGITYQPSHDDVSAQSNSPCVFIVESLLTSQ